MKKYLLGSALASTLIATAGFCAVVEKDDLSKDPTQLESTIAFIDDEETTISLNPVSDDLVAEAEEVLSDAKEMIAEAEEMIANAEEMIAEAEEMIANAEEEVALPTDEEPSDVSNDTSDELSSIADDEVEATEPKADETASPAEEPAANTVSETTEDSRRPCGCETDAEDTAVASIADDELSDERRCGVPPCCATETEDANLAAAEEKTSDERRRRGGCAVEGDDTCLVVADEKTEDERRRRGCCAVEEENSLSSISDEEAVEGEVTILPYPNPVDGAAEQELVSMDAISDEVSCQQINCCGTDATCCGTDSTCKSDCGCGCDPSEPAGDKDYDEDIE